MAHVLALTRDLLFGSQVQGALSAAGHEVELIDGESQLRERLKADGQTPARGEGSVDILVVDLTDAELNGSAIVSALADEGVLSSLRTLAYYSHVDSAARQRAEQVGFDLAVPRSRMAREAAALVAGLLARD
jgi:hypothetical protein